MTRTLYDGPRRLSAVPYAWVFTVLSTLRLPIGEEP